MCHHMYAQVPCPSMHCLNCAPPFPILAQVCFARNLALWLTVPPGVPTRPCLSTPTALSAFVVVKNVRLHICAGGVGKEVLDGASRAVRVVRAHGATE